MEIQEIKDAVDEGLKVHWANPAYVVIKDSLGQYLIKCLINDHCIGLTNRTGDQLNGQPEDFFVSVLATGRIDDNAAASKSPHHS